MTRRSLAPQVSRLLGAALFKVKAWLPGKTGRGGGARIEVEARLHEGKGRGGSEALQCRRASEMHVTSIADFETTPAVPPLPTFHSSTALLGPLQSPGGALVDVVASCSRLSAGIQVSRAASVSGTPCTSRQRAQRRYRYRGATPLSSPTPLSCQRAQRRCRYRVATPLSSPTPSSR